MLCKDDPTSFAGSAKLLCKLTTLLAVGLVAAEAVVLMLTVLCAILPEAIMAAAGSLPIIGLVRWLNRRDHQRAATPNTTSRPNLIAWSLLALILTGVVAVSSARVYGESQARTLAESAAVNEVIRLTGRSRESMKASAERDGANWWVYIRFYPQITPGSHCSVSVSSDGKILSVAGGK
jgi:hypothetical protein